MTSSFFKFFLIIIIFFSILISCFIPIVASTSSGYNGEFIWPLTNYTYISSYFGNRSSPTSGASSYHSGIDIPAPEGTPILAVCSGTVTFASWGAGGGYMIVVKKSWRKNRIGELVSFNFVQFRSKTVLK